MKMNYFLNSVAVMLVLAFAIGCKNKPKSEGIQTYAELKKLITDPPSEYRTAPLWDWNDKISEEGIDFHMKKFKEGGLGGVFIHPRPGLLTEYISEDWHHLFDYTVRKGKELGMKVWIYDENSYPSGFAGGHVPAIMPESYNLGTGLSCDTVNILKADTAKYEVILEVDNKTFKDITATKESYIGKKGTYYRFKKTYSSKSYWYGNFPYVDLLQKGVTQKFIEITMKGYEKYDKDEFGKTMMGIFSDEPNLEAAMSENTVIRWTTDLYAEFEKRWGYNLKLNLPSIVYQVGNWKKVRHDYYLLLCEMFVDRWTKPYSEYCSAQGISLTGHFWEHGWPMPTDGFDEAANYLYQQMPGVDMLGNEYIPNGLGGQFGNTRAIREVQSTANQAGHRRRLSETYGGAGWEVPFANLKKLVDWEVVLGINFVNQHLAYYTIKGVRKFDYPPSFTYHEPWWDNYKLMGDYIGRISMATSAGEQINKTLVLQPNTTSWMYFSRTDKNTIPESIKESFKSFVYQLERNHFEYDLGSEYVMKAIGSVKEGKLIVGKRAYELVVIPESMKNIEQNTYAMIKDYLAQGGKVLSFTSDIPFLDGNESTAINDLKTAYPKQWNFASKVDEEKVKTLFATADFSLQESNPAKGELYYQRRIMEDGQLLFVVNSDTAQNVLATVNAKGKSLIKMDLATGDCLQIPTKENRGQLSFEISLPPVGSALYYLTDSKTNEPSLTTTPKNEHNILPTDTLTVRPTGDNVLVLDFLDLKTSKVNLKEIYFMKAMHKLFDTNGFKMGNPWQHKIQYKKQYLELDTFKTNSAFVVNYHFTIGENASAETMKKLSAVVERPELWEVYLNGEKVEKSNQWWIDREFYKYPIGDKVKKGSNLLTLKAPKMSVFAELMPAYIVGDFILNPLKQGFEISSGTISKTGSWKTMGYPFYAQKVSYAEHFNVNNSGEQYKVKLNKWNGILTEVFVNNTKAGTIAYPPYELNISKFMTPGKNEVSVNVIGSLKNTFGYFYKDNHRWINGPGDWDTAPDKTARMDQYLLMDYGLFEPFSLIKTN
jgi:alpha-L-rhamnosidase